MLAAIGAGPTRVFVALLATALAACAPSADEVRTRHTGGAAAASTPAAATVAPGPVSDADYVAAVAETKQAMPFTVRFHLDARPRVGTPLRVDVVVTPVAQAQIRSLKFRFEAGEGLQFEGDPEFVINGATPGIAVRRELQVTPRTVGVLEMHARATVETPSEALSQTYSIPVIVAADAP